MNTRNVSQLLSSALTKMIKSLLTGVGELAATVVGFMVAWYCTSISH